MYHRVAAKDLRVASLIISRSVILRPPRRGMNSSAVESFVWVAFAVAFVVVLAFVAVFAVVLAVAVVAGDVSAAVAASTLLAFDSEYVPTARVSVVESSQLRQMAYASLQREQHQDWIKQGGGGDPREISHEGVNDLSNSWYQASQHGKCDDCQIDISKVVPGRRLVGEDGIDGRGEHVLEAVLSIAIIAIVTTA
eukprot:CAMPEP_0198116772 /NCGR_PEP_ID=MMETSP1442-20131203/14458_1 /TAXON_ID= /ORGANISM="Craspedostauros australis, Strain CCMP3328" /LENGTH=194 /DNA_ID=CAMNT_0043774675 /DNA_START=426 /DNA_END=1008 /DNA_ORIENTATION=-